MNHSIRNVLFGLLLMALSASATFGIMRWQQAGSANSAQTATQTETVVPATAKPVPPTTPPNKMEPSLARSPSEIMRNNPNGPWTGDLMMATSSDGTTFGTASLFMERAGVPSVIRDASGRLVASFQWFPENNDSAWDKIAVTFSSDEGLTWTDPEPISVSDIPSEYMRPFDPTLTLQADGTIRLFFTLNNAFVASNESMPFIGSAVSTDGIHYAFEPGTRLAVEGKQVIDCAAVLLGDTWHLYSPARDIGAYHATSSDGTTFVRQDDVSSVPWNWLGNVIVSGSGVRFYGSGPGKIWWSSSEDGTVWTEPQLTNVPGADPGIARKSDGTYLIIYTAKSNR